MSNDKLKPLRIGVLILPPSQLLDVSPVDLFGMLTREYLKACRLPAPILALGIPIEILYISATASPQPESITPLEVKFAELTANAALRVTATIHDVAAAPGKLDIVMIPGPDPNLDPPENMRKFIRNHFDTGCVIMSVCTGIFPLAASGVLKGREATGPRALLGELKKKYPETFWSDERWCKDDNIWSSGGITNGLDMVAAYIKEKYPGPLSDAVCAIADVGDRKQEYGTGTVAENAWWLLVILKAWFRGTTN